MTLCLAHPMLGYYTTRKVFGSKGDFITSPEISQIFGEVSTFKFGRTGLGVADASPHSAPCYLVCDSMGCAGQGAESTHCRARARSRYAPHGHLEGECEGMRS